MSVRVRFAPSPTGYLHVGGARTALFNWLYARHRGGTFVLRIEDTDAERSSAAMIDAILGGLRWLGLDWDEGPDIGGPRGPYFQAERSDLHRDAARALVAGGHAYYCYCTADELNAKRQAAEAAGGAWLYDRTCRALSAQAIASREAAGQSRTVRVLVPDGDTRFDDMVHGPITIANRTIEDFIVLRSDGAPTYNLSVVCDDIGMAITDVIRGDDHISNTPKQIILYRALGAPVPRFAHVPLILGPDRKRLSKRHGATAVGEYENQGYLAEGMMNFLALLGWSPGSGNEELFTRDELISRFTVEGISGGNAVFNPDKLDWFNQQHLLRLTDDDLIARLEPFLTTAGLWDDRFGDARRDWLVRVLALLKPRARTLVEVASQLRPFVVDLVERDPAAVAKYLGDPGVLTHLGVWRHRLQEVASFQAGPLEAALRTVAAERGIKPGVLIHATRVAVVGQANSPGLFEVLELVGRPRVIARIDEVLTASAASP
jgi:glutamyl-tRNA synthetase